MACCRAILLVFFVFLALSSLTVKEELLAEVAGVVAGVLLGVGGSFFGVAGSVLGVA